MFYYSLNGSQAGPVSEEQLRQLEATGIIAPETLVWREGMPDWQPYSAVLGSAPAAAPSAAATATVQCSVCKQNFAPDQVIRYGDAHVCAGCKPRFVQGLREGAVSPENERRTLYAIALNQRRAVLCVGVSMICFLAQTLLAPRLPMAALVVALGTMASGIFTIIAIYRLARTLGMSAVLYVIVLLFPCIGLLSLLYIVSKATTVLRKAGIHVGIFGVNKATLDQLRS